MNKKYLLLFILTIVSCANVDLHKDYYDDPNFQPRILKEKTMRSKTDKKAVFLHSFWNNQEEDLSKVKPIDYSVVIKEKEFYAALSEKLNSKNQLLFPHKKLRISKKNLSLEEHKENQLSLYNSIVMIREYLTGHPIPSGFKSASFPSLIKLKDKKNDELWDCYIVIGMEQLFVVKEGRRYVRSGIAVVKVDSEGEYLGIAIDTYDFTKITSETMAVIVAELINALET